jgi:hypothetical protein
MVLWLERYSTQHEHHRPTPGPRGQRPAHLSGAVHAARPNPAGPMLAEDLSPEDRRSPAR